MNDETRRAAEMNNQYRTTYAQALSNEGQTRALERARVTDRNQQHKAARRAHIEEALATVDKFNAQRRAFDDANRNNIITLTQLKAAYPNADLSGLKKAFPEYAEYL